MSHKHLLGGSIPLTGTMDTQYRRTNMRWFIILLALLIVTPVVAQEVSIEVVKRAAVVYPDSAKVKGIEGTVMVQATIGTNGLVKVVSVTKSDNKILNEAAMDAVLKWQFKPIPKEYNITIPIRFKLSS